MYFRKNSRQSAGRSVLKKNFNYLKRYTRLEKKYQRVTTDYEHCHDILSQKSKIIRYYDAQVS